jgi:hypothetical protein
MHHYQRFCRKSEKKSEWQALGKAGFAESRICGIQAFLGF